MDVKHIILLCTLCSDLRERLIPNVLVGVLLVYGLAVRWIDEGIKGVLIGSAIVLIVVGIMIPFYLKRMIGAGDIKLLGTVSGIILPEQILHFWFYSFAVALLIALVMNLGYGAKKSEGVPLALPICLAFFYVTGGK
ncbi:Type IV leader peptidase family protein [Lachnospiraceae bacterium G11]|nr:Type IV leader peptidase family protein [Lachnospiraceae bacterium G11]